MSKKLFVVGTGTDVGKTYVTGLILKKLCDSRKNAAYFKAAMSGNQRDVDEELIPGDALSVKLVSKVEQPLEKMCPYVYEYACSPHLAALLEKKPVEMQVIKNAYEELCKRYDYITLEGVGGVICPFRFDDKQFWQEDVIKDFNAPCILVADAGLGTINAVGLTVAYMQMRNIVVKGIIFNNFHTGSMLDEDNLRMCETITGLQVIACVSQGDDELSIDVDVLASLYE